MPVVHPPPLHAGVRRRRAHEGPQRASLPQPSVHPIPAPASARLTSVCWLSLPLQVRLKLLPLLLEWDVRQGPAPPPSAGVQFRPSAIKAASKVGAAKAGAAAASSQQQQQQPAPWRYILAVERVNQEAGRQLPGSPGRAVAEQAAEDAAIDAAWLAGTARSRPAAPRPASSQQPPSPFKQLDLLTAGEPPGGPGCAKTAMGRPPASTLRDVTQLTSRRTYLVAALQPSWKGLWGHSYPPHHTACRCPPPPPACRGWRRGCCGRAAVSGQRGRAQGGGHAVLWRAPLCAQQPAGRAVAPPDAGQPAGARGLPGWDRLQGAAMEREACHSVALTPPFSSTSACCCIRPPSPALVQEYAERLAGGGASRRRAASGGAASGRGRAGSGAGSGASSGARVGRPQVGSRPAGQAALTHFFSPRKVGMACPCQCTRQAAARQPAQNIAHPCSSQRMLWLCTATSACSHQLTRACRLHPAMQGLCATAAALARAAACQPPHICRQAGGRQSPFFPRLTHTMACCRLHRALLALPVPRQPQPALRSPAPARAAQPGGGGQRRSCGRPCCPPWPAPARPPARAPGAAQGRALTATLHPGCATAGSRSSCWRRRQQVPAVASGWGRRVMRRAALHSSCTAASSWGGPTMQQVGRPGAIRAQVPPYSRVTWHAPPPPQSLHRWRSA